MSFTRSKQPQTPGTTINTTVTEESPNSTLTKLRSKLQVTQDYIKKKMKDSQTFSQNRQRYPLHSLQNANSTLFRQNRSLRKKLKFIENQIKSLEDEEFSTPVKNFHEKRPSMLQLLSDVEDDIQDGLDYTFDKTYPKTPSPTHQKDSVRHISELPPEFSSALYSRRRRKRSRDWGQGEESWREFRSETGIRRVDPYEQDYLSQSRQKVKVISGFLKTALYTYQLNALHF